MLRLYDLEYDGPDGLVTIERLVSVELAFGESIEIEVSGIKYLARRAISAHTRSNSYQWGLGRHDADLPPVDWDGKTPLR